MNKLTIAPRNRVLLMLVLGIGTALPCSCEQKPPEPPLTGAESRPPQVVELLNRAVEAHQRGYPFRVVQFLQAAYEQAPDDLDIALDLGDTLNRLLHHDSAYAHYEEFLSRHPSATEARLAGGLTLITLGQWEEAARQLQQVVQEEPGDLVGRVNLGKVLDRLGRHEEAVVHLKEAEAIDPAYAETQALLGVAYQHLNRIEEAAAALEKALRLEPGNVPALFTLGNCYGRLGRTEEAEATLARFREASLKKEKFIDEKRLFRAAQATAFELAEAGQPERALRALLAYQDQLKDFPPFHQELGIACVKTGQSREAMAAFEKAVAMDPSLVEAQSHLIVLYKQAGEFEKAKRTRAALARQESSRPRTKR